jgi:iron complex outermembrane recepter protein
VALLSSVFWSIHLASFVPRPSSALIRPSLILASAAILSPCASATDAQAETAADLSAPDIVVTANRREQALDSLPASDKVFTSTQMEALGAKNVADLVRYAPGVTYDYTTNTISIRGISSAAGAGVTGIYIDDAPIQMRTLDFNSNNALPPVFDLARVEVLRGPQGTLFGAGSEGGTIRYITVQPSLTNFSGVARAEVAFTQGGAPTEEAGAAVGGPIIGDTLGFRLNAWARRDGGWIDQVDSATGLSIQRNANATDTQQFRAALSWAPSARLLITPALTYQDRDHKFYDQYWVALSAPRDNRFVSGTPDKMVDQDRFVLPTLLAQYDFDGAQFTSSTSYLERHEDVNGYSGTLYDLSYFQQLIDPSQPGGPVDPAFNPCPACRSDLYPLLTADGINLPGLPDFRVDATITNKQFNFTQEFRLQSTDPSARLTWLVGVFLADQKQHSTDKGVDPGLPALAQYLFGETMDDIWGMGLPASNIEYINDTISHDRQAALFADATFAITDTVKLNGALRYAATHFEFTNYSDGPLNFGRAGGGGQQDEQPLTPKIGVSYQPSVDDLFYVSAAKGYRIGGANAPFPQSICQADLDALQIASVPESYKSDSVMSYEFGARNRLLGGRMTSAFSVFHAQWSNIQQSNYLTSCGFQYTANLGEAVSNGFDLEAHLRASAALQLDVSLGYTDARYSATTRSGASPAAPILVAKGDSLGSPRWALALGGQYDFTILDQAAFVRADYAFSSGDPRRLPSRDAATTSYDPSLTAQPKTEFVSARAGTTIRRAEASLFVENLFDAHPQINLNHLDQYTLLFEATTFRPRTVGLSVVVRY